MQLYIDFAKYRLKQFRVTLLLKKRKDIENENKKFNKINLTSSCYT